MPVSIAIGAAVLMTFLTSDFSDALYIIPQQILEGVNKPSLAEVPFFIILKHPIVLFLPSSDGSAHEKIAVSEANKLGIPVVARNLSSSDLVLFESGDRIRKINANDNQQQL